MEAEFSNMTCIIHTPVPRSHAALRLFCFHHAGGRETFFRSWSAALPPEVELSAVGLPGRGTRIAEPPYQQWSPLVADAARLVGRFKDKPFALLGFSMGALIAFEVARRLRETEGLSPVLLVPIAAPAPHVHPPWRGISSANDIEFLAFLQDKIGLRDGVSEYPDLLRLMIEITRADFKVLGSYRYVSRSELDCPMLAFAGIADRLVQPHDVEAWRLHSRKNFSLVVLPGDHYCAETSRALLLKKLRHQFASLGIGAAEASAFQPTA